MIRIIPMLVLSLTLSVRAQTDSAATSLSLVADLPVATDSSLQAATAAPLLAMRDSAATTNPTDSIPSAQAFADSYRIPSGDSIISPDAGGSVATAKDSTPSIAPRKPIVALQPLSGKGLTAEEADLIGDALAAELQRTDSVRVMERSQMDKILSEQGFQNSGACSGSDCVVQMGQLLGIDDMVVGTVGRLGGSYILNVRLVSVATGEVVRSSSRNLEAPIDAVVTILAPVVAKELVGGVPDLAALESAQREAREAKARAAAPPVVPVVSQPEPKSSSALWWTAGGIAVAGGAAAAAFLLLQEDEPAPATAPQPAQKTEVWVNW